MRAFPAGFLLLALALIAAVQMMKAAYGDDTVKSMTHRMALRSMLKTTYGEDTVRIALETTAGSSTAGSTSGVSVLPVTTTVVLGPAQLTFSKQRCASVPKKAVKQRNAQVWWSGPKGSSKANSGGKATGVACSQVKFFGKDGCQGKEIDSMANPGTTTAVKNTKKQLQKGVSVASVLCALPEQQQKEDSPQQPQPNADPACAALGCEPVGGTCEVDGNGERYCKWDSPCGICPTGATCKTVAATFNSAVPVPYCACPQGFGITASKCVEGGRSTVSSFSSTFIANRTAKDASSRPYTFRVNLIGCTQIPAAVVGKVTTMYIVDGIDGAPSCRSFKNYATDNCRGASEFDSSGGTPHAGYVLDIPPMTLRSIRCIR
ncbi:unnamed protein product [Closterium sp. NIES-54]